MLRIHNNSVFKGFVKLEGKKFENLKKNVSESKINLIYRGYTVILK